MIHAPAYEFGCTAVDTKGKLNLGHVKIVFSKCLPMPSVPLPHESNSEVNIFGTVEKIGISVTPAPPPSTESDAGRPAAAYERTAGIRASASSR